MSFRRFPIWRIAPLAAVLLLVPLVAVAQQDLRIDNQSVTKPIGTGPQVSHLLVTRTGSTVAASFALIVRVPGGTATAGPEFDSFGNEVTVCPAGTDFLVGGMSGHFDQNVTSTLVEFKLCNDPQEAVLDRTFIVDLANYQPAGDADPDNNTATITILDPRVPPRISILDTSVGEGGVMSFPVQLSRAFAHEIDVHYHTILGPAPSAKGEAECFDFGLRDRVFADFVGQPAVTGGPDPILKFPPGVMVERINVATCDDMNPEPDEFFSVVLSSTSAGVIVDGTGVGKIIANDGFTGGFELQPDDATVSAGDDVAYTLTWTVPEGRVWRNLKTIDLRLADSDTTAIWVRWDEATNSLHLVNPAGRQGHGGQPGDHLELTSSLARLDLEHSSVAGSGPAGRSVTLTLDLELEHNATGHTFAVEIAGTDDLGNADPFARAGRLIVHSETPEALSKHESGWPMAGHDINNTRNQPFDSAIGRQNARQLAPKWIVPTFGDVSATPAVVGDDDKNRGHNDGHRATSVYFPDWGGKLWKIDAETGQVLWMRSIPDYNGIAGSLSRTSPVVTEGMVYVGDLNGNMMALDSASGDLRWIMRPDPNPAAIITASPIVFGDRLYIGTSSNETSYARTHPGYVCCTFRGSMTALDTRTGRIVWQTFVLPDNGGHPGAFAGGAFVNPPAINLDEGLIYAGAGNLYTEPASVTSCLAAASAGWSESCFGDAVRFNSVVAFDLRTGNVRWSFRGSGPDARKLACGSLPASVTWCPPTPGSWPLPPASLFSVWDFAGSGPNVFQARIAGRTRNVVGIGQKSGVYWALDAETGEYLWSRLVGPGSDPGGIQWGTSYDGQRIYAAIGHNTGQPYTLPSGQVITGGSWAAIDPSTGRILWQTPDPQGSPDLGALSTANGVLYGGSMAHTGDQMYALDALTGAILWRFSAGGSVVAGPAVVNGTVYWGSGYARTGGVGNNKFYAFSIDGR